MVTPTDYPSLRDCRRINVVGTSGSGKSTLARQLADGLQIPYFEMDRLFWKQNWQESTDDEFFPTVDEVTIQDKWVLDGNYTRTTPIKWRRVELVVWLDMSFARTFYRVTKRVFQRSLSNQEIWPGTGNRETLRKALLSRDSIILWMLTSYHRNRKKYLETMQSSDYEHIRFVHLTAPREVQRFLEAFCA
ncbi:MAG: adenylate kinase [Planctomycetaceae bacterium]|nr:adenylate kinase [Planctomycetaceae bacterium]